MLDCSAKQALQSTYGVVIQSKHDLLKIESTN